MIQDRKDLKKNMCEITVDTPKQFSFLSVLLTFIPSHLVGELMVKEELCLQLEIPVTYCSYGLLSERIDALRLMHSTSLLQSRNCMSNDLGNP